MSYFFHILLSRYIESNIRYTSAYRRYNESLPKWLHNRPRQFVTHCQKRLSFADTMQRSSITNVGHGEFMVESQSSNVESYKVQFGDVNTMPSCSCFDWKKHHWPCKHFLAIYNHFPEWGWERMSPSYTSSPYFKIDSLVIPVDSDTNRLGSDSPSLSSTSSNGTCSSENVPQVHNIHPALDEVPDEANDPEEGSNGETHHLKQIINPQQEGRCCREILKEIQNLSYLCQDGSALAELKNDLQKLSTKFKQHVPSENGILVEVPKSTKKTKKQIKQTKEQKTKRKEYAKLPLHLKRKNNDSIDVSSPVKKQRKVITTPEQNISIVLEKEDNMLPNVTTGDEEEKVQQLVFSDDSQTIQAHSHASIANSEGKQDLLDEERQFLPYAKLNTPHCQEPSTSVILVDENSPDPETWLNINDYTSCTKVTLYQVSKNNILNKKGWLTDSEIHAGQVLLKKEFPLIDGLWDPAIREDLVTPAISEFVQIINIGSHWICMSTISSSPGTVKIYDTLNNSAHSIAIRHACHMLMYNGDSVLFVNERVQRQINLSDCGLFSLAIATDLCNAIDPSSQSYDQGSLRQHYVHCL